MIPRRLAIVCLVAMVATSLFAFAPPAQAAQQTAEPALLTLGWWWKDAQSESRDIGGNTVEAGTSSPFCPSAPGSLGEIPGACASGRFPVEIRGGEYEEPHMLSGLGFDLSVLTPGSEVFKFELKLLEAESGCYDGNDDGDECTPGTSEGDHIENTDPIGPVDERGVKACLLTQIFGDADARPYREVPNYECPSDAPVATRKEIKTVDPKTDNDEVDHIWTFDLTAYAQEWAEAFSFNTAIMLVGDEPRQPQQNDTWRVVFAGPRAEKGIQAKLVYEPGEIAPPPPPPPPGSTDPGFTGGTSTTSFGGGTTAGPSFGGSTDTGTGTDAGGEVPAPAESPGLDVAGAEGPEIEGMPAYVWLALLAGLVAFAMVRQVVVESATGIRPNGVLARIHALNAERRGLEEAAAAVAGPSPLAGLATVGRVIGHRFSKLLSKLPGRG
ncbi:MAG: hypothetical protein M3277_11355 [Actinomycetota bacterium]|nr:hypothetical protein [Actinomycetota bacterium]